MNYKKSVAVLGSIFVISGILLFTVYLEAQAPWPDPPGKNTFQYKVNSVPTHPDGSITVTRVDDRGNIVEKKVYPASYVKLVGSLYEFVTKPEAMDTLKQVIPLKPSQEKFITVSIPKVYELLIGQKIKNVKLVPDDNKEESEEESEENEEETEGEAVEWGCPVPMCPIFGTDQCVICGVQ